MSDARVSLRPAGLPRVPCPCCRYDRPVFPQAVVFYVEQNIQVCLIVSVGYLWRAKVWRIRPNFLAMACRRPPGGSCGGAEESDCRGLGKTSRAHPPRQQGGGMAESGCRRGRMRGGRRADARAATRAGGRMSLRAAVVAAVCRRQTGTSAACAAAGLLEWNLPLNLVQ